MSLGEAVKTIITDGPDGKDTGIFADIQQYFKDFLVTMKGKGYAYDIFEKNLFFLKALGLIFIIVLAIVNYSLYKDSGLIKKEPLSFVLFIFVFVCIVCIVSLYAGGAAVSGETVTRRPVPR